MVLLPIECVPKRRRVSPLLREIIAEKYCLDTPAGKQSGRSGIIFVESLYSLLRDFAAAGYSRFMQVAPKQPKAPEPDELGQVLHFPVRRSANSRFPGPAAPTVEPEPADDLSRYEQEQDEPVDYRQRMLMNTIAVVRPWSAPASGSPAPLPKCKKTRIA
jgi:hypothetical protein